MTYFSEKIDSACYIFSKKSFINNKTKITKYGISIYKILVADSLTIYFIELTLNCSWNSTMSLSRPAYIKIYIFFLLILFILGIEK